MAAAASAYPELKPKYELHPESGQLYWPSGKEGTAYYRSVRAYTEAAFEEASYDNRQSEEVREVQKYIDYIVGNQWPAGRPTYKSKPVNNRIWPIFWELVSLLTDIRPMFEVLTYNKEFQQHADILNAATKSWWLENDADLKLAFIIIYALLGTGYGKLTWDRFARNGQGDFDLIPCGPSDVLPLKARFHIQDAQAVIYRSVVAVDWVKNKFPLTGAAVEPDLKYSRFQVAGEKGNFPGSKMMFDMLSPQMQYRYTGGTSNMKPSSFPMCLYREYWLRDFTMNASNATVKMGRDGWKYEVKPGERLYPRGRLVIMAGEGAKAMPLDDCPNPYAHGMYPFGCLRMNPVPWQFLGLSDLKPLMSLQDIVNNVLAGILDMVKKALNPVMLAPRNAIAEGLWNSLDNSMPGLRIAYNPNAAAPPTWQPAPNIPGYVMMTYDRAAAEMDRTSSGATAASAARKKQVPGAETLAELQNAQQTPVRLKGRWTEVFLRDLGKMDVYNIFQFYDKKRRFFMLGEKGITTQDSDQSPNSMVPHGSTVEDHAKNFSFMIRPGTLLNLDKAQRAMTVLALRRQGDIDRRTMYGELEMGVDVGQIEVNLQKELTDKLAMVAKAQRPGGG